MAQDIALLNAIYHDVPAVQLPKSGGGTALFVDTTTNNGATSADIPSGKEAWANGVKVIGSAVPATEKIVELYKENGIWKPLPSFNELEEAYNSGKVFLLYIPTTEEDPEIVSCSGDFVYPSRGTPVLAPTFQYWIRTLDANNNTLTDTYYEFTQNDVTTKKTEQTYVLPPTGTLNISANGNGINVKDYEFVNVAVPTQKNTQVATGTKRVAATAYTDVGYEITVAKTGTYNVHWAGWRSSTSGTNGAQLYVNGTASGSAVTSFDATWTNVQNGSRNNVSLTQGDKVTLRARSRGTSYYMYIFFLSIEEV